METSGPAHAGTTPAVSNQSLTDAAPDRKLISDAVLYWAEILLYIGLNSVISLLGMAANVVNIIVFIRQGLLSESSTFCLFLLSVSDFMSLLPLLWMATCFILSHIRPPNLPFNINHMMIITAARPHITFVQLTSWITVYIAFERCMCVMFPFKVRRLFTARRTAVQLSTLILVIFCGAILPYYIFEYLVWWEVTGENRSILVWKNNWPKYKDATLGSVFAGITSLGLRPAALLLVLTFTQITVFRLNASRKWRQMTSSLKSKTKKDKTKKSDLVDSDKDQDEINPGDSKSSEMKSEGKTGLGNREKRLTMMISTVCSIFIACMTPDIAFVIYEKVEPRVRSYGLYKNFFYFTYSISFFMEGLNSSINIFVYYNMSTKYKCEFRKLFGFNDEPSK